MNNAINGKYLFSHKNWDLQQEQFCNKTMLDKEFTDVTLASNDDRQVDAHRIMLSSQSKFFNRILKTNPRRDILIYLPNVNHLELQLLLEYIYLGKTETTKENVNTFIEIGKYYDLHGFEEESILADVDDEGKSFLNEVTDQGFKGDMLTIKKQKLERQTNGKFACEHCDFESVNRRNINRHNASVHLGVKYQCQECPKEYTSTALLKAHVNGKHRGQIYQCDQCNETFGHPKIYVFI